MFRDNRIKTAKLMHEHIGQLQMYVNITTALKSRISKTILLVFYSVQIKTMRL